MAVWRASGEPASTFAGNRGWSATRLRWWASKLREPAISSRPVSKPPAFVALEGAAAPRHAATVASGSIEIVLAGGRRVRVRGAVAASDLRLVLAVLEA